LIIDELRGRREASRRQLRFIGTLGVLRSAADQGLLDFMEAIVLLRSTSFRMTQEVIERLMRGE
jgi:predicted nucleic acid-binding protein